MNPGRGGPAKPARGGLARALAVALLGAAACAAPPAPSVDADAERPTPPVQAARPLPPPPLDVYIREAARAANLDRSGALARLGAADSVGARAVSNRHDPSITDTVVTLHYPASRYVYYVVTAAGRDLLDLAVIGSNEHLRHARPGIGTPADSVRAWFGAPARATDAELEYECAACEVAQPVTFEIDDGRVRRIRFDYYVD